MVEFDEDYCKMIIKSGLLEVNIRNLFSGYEFVKPDFEDEDIEQFLMLFEILEARYCQSGME